MSERGESSAIQTPAPTRLLVLTHPSAAAGQPAEIEDFCRRLEDRRPGLGVRFMPFEPLEGLRDAAELMRPSGASLSVSTTLIFAGRHFQVDVTSAVDALRVGLRQRVAEVKAPQLPIGATMWLRAHLASEVSHHSSVLLVAHPSAEPRAQRSIDVLARNLGTPCEVRAIGDSGVIQETVPAMVATHGSVHIVPLVAFQSAVPGFFNDLAGSGVTVAAGLSSRDWFLDYLASAVT